MKQLIETLNSLGNKAWRIFPYINEGGCCVYASLVVEQLEARGIKATGIACNYKTYGMSLATARAVITDTSNTNEWAMNGICFNHVAVEFNVDGVLFHYDVEGVRKPSSKFGGMQIYGGRLKPKELDELAMSEDWNPAFDRSKIPKMRKMVRKAFEEMNV